MSAISIQNITKTYAGVTVLSEINLALHKGEKVGLVGANGSGKTTLFKLIMGLEDPDSGTVTRSKGLSVGYLPQQPDLRQDAGVFETVCEVFAEQREREAELQALSQKIAETHDGEQAVLLEKYDRLKARFETDGGYGYEVRIREVLGGLGFAQTELKQPIRALSGGQKCRVSLARLLMQDCDLLLLDEPTNHLDIDATRWLERFLSAHDGGAVIISHDRYMLDRVVSKIIEVEQHGVTVFPTNYTGYAEAKRLRRVQALREFEKQSSWLAHQRDYIERTRYRKDTAKQSRARQNLLKNMKSRGEILDKPTGDAAEMKLKFKDHGKGGDMVIRCEGATKGFGDVQLIHDLDFEMNVGETVGIIGPNGVGKTTLLRMLLKQIDPDAGVVRLFENLSIGYYDQEHRDLDPKQTIIEAVRGVRPETSEGEARSYLALFLFRGDDVFKRVGNLSGGEQSRVLLARLVWKSPQVLILDEPTNHLDIPAREALEQALRLYTGSILMVSHDRYFLDQIASRLLVLVKRTEHEVIDGSWSKYAEILEQREAAARAEEMRRKEAAEAARKSEAKKSGAGKKSRSKYATKKIEEMEDRIIAMESRVEEIEAAFADPETMKDAARQKSLHDEYDKLRADLVELNAKWEEAAE